MRDSLTSYFRQCIITDRSFCIVMDLDNKVYSPGCSRLTAWWVLTKIKEEIFWEKFTWSPVSRAILHLDTRGWAGCLGFVEFCVSSIFFLHKCCLLYQLNGWWCCPSTAAVQPTCDVQISMQGSKFLLTWRRKHMRKHIPLVAPNSKNLHVLLFFFLVCLIILIHRRAKDNNRDKGN